MQVTRNKRIHVWWFVPLAAVLVTLMATQVGIAQARPQPLGQNNGIQPYCIPQGNAPLKKVELASSEVVVQLPRHAASGKRGVAPFVDDVAYYHTYLWGQENACGQVTLISGQCTTSTAPAAITYQNCTLEKNEAQQWSPGFQQFNTGGTNIASQQSPWFAAGPTGTTWSCGLAAESVFDDGGVLDSPKWPGWGTWSYTTVN